MKTAEQIKKEELKILEIKKNLLMWTIAILSTVYVILTIYTNATINKPAGQTVIREEMN